jgi:hypothetical protein
MYICIREEEGGRDAEGEPVEYSDLKPLKA